MLRITELSGCVCRLSPFPPSRITNTNCLPARVLQPTRPPLDRRRQRARRPNQRHQLREAEKGRRSHPPALRREPLRLGRLAHRHLVRAGALRLRHAQDPHPAAHGGRYLVGERLRDLRSIVPTLADHVGRLDGYARRQVLFGRGCAVGQSVTEGREGQPVEPGRCVDSCASCDSNKS